VIQVVAIARLLRQVVLWRLQVPVLHLNVMCLQELAVLRARLTGNVTPMEVMRAMRIRAHQPITPVLPRKMQRARTT